MGVREVKTTKKIWIKKQLVSLIGELYKKNKSIKEYFDSYLHPNEIELLSKYLEKVSKHSFPKEDSDIILRKGKNYKRF